MASHAHTGSLTRVDLIQTMKKLFPNVKLHLHAETLVLQRVKQIYLRSEQQKYSPMC